MNINFTTREIQMLLEALDCHLKELQASQDAFKDNTKVLLLLTESIDGINKLKEKITQEGN